MKYKAIIDTDDYKGFEFFEDGNGKYMVGKDASVTAYGGWMPLYFTEVKEETVTEFADRCRECGKVKKLEIAKGIIKAFYEFADCGIYNSRNTAGDAMETIYDNCGLTIDICYYYSYFEVFGLNDAEFKELEKYYNSLEGSEE